jgi:hypothetical protein
MELIDLRCRRTDGRRSCGVLRDSASALAHSGRIDARQTADAVGREPSVSRHGAGSACARNVSANPHAPSANNNGPTTRWRGATRRNSSPQSRPVSRRTSHPPRSATASGVPLPDEVSAARHRRPRLKSCLHAGPSWSTQSATLMWRIGSTPPRPTPSRSVVLSDEVHAGCHGRILCHRRPISASPDTSCTRIL